MPITVSIVEDDAGVRDGLVRLLGRAKDFRCLGAYPSAEAALRELPSARPDVVLMDINLPGMNGVECVRKLKVEAPSTQMVMLTVYENPDHIFEALAAGASGYLLKQTPPAELLAAVREVHGGGAPMSSQIARKVVQSFRESDPVADPAARLTEREAELLSYLTKGYANKEIADRMAITVPTVRTHLRNIYEKLHVRSRTEAAVKYMH